MLSFNVLGVGREEIEDEKAREMANVVYHSLNDNGFDVDGVAPVLREREADAEPEKTAIRAHEASDGLYFCWYDESHWDWNVEKVEHLFYQCDDEKRATDSLTPEDEREDDAPVVGHIEHRQGDIERITFDLTDWYGEDATFEFDSLPDWGSR